MLTSAREKCSKLLNSLFQGDLKLKDISNSRSSTEVLYHTKHLFKFTSFKTTVPVVLNQSNRNPEYINQGRRQKNFQGGSENSPKRILLRYLWRVRGALSIHPGLTSKELCIKRPI